MLLFKIVIALCIIIGLGESLSHSNSIRRCGNGEHPGVVSTFDDAEIVNGSSQHSSRIKRHAGHYTGSQNQQRYIEILVAVDDTMNDYYGSDLKKYILSLMSTAQKVFADPSIGNSISLSVKNIISIDDLDDVRTLSVGKESGKDVYQFLEHFCDHMGSKESHMKADVSLLLTRHTFCSDRSHGEPHCTTVGLANVGTMCGKSACLIVKDSGLPAGFTIAHELGHVLNCPHDNEKSCVKHQNKKEWHTMGPFPDETSDLWSWSECSRRFITDFINEPQADCLLNKPTFNMLSPSSAISIDEKFLDLGKQCEAIFGYNAADVSVEFTKEKFTCDKTLCYKKEGHGNAFHQPWVDGTECANEKWCQRGKCVEKSSKNSGQSFWNYGMDKIDGGWGEWENVGRGCSKICGGGEQFLTRKCNNPTPQIGGKDCEGSSSGYKKCNTQPCKYKWKIRWTKCSLSCGGHKSEVAECVDIQTNRILPDFYCSTPKPTKLIERRPCNRHCVFEWSPKSSKCSVECGVGTHTVSFSCMKRNIELGVKQVVSDVNCPTFHNRQRTEICEVKCNFKWKLEWSKCSDGSKKGMQKLQLICARKFNDEKEQYESVDNYRCSHLKKPLFTHKTRKCSEYGDYDDNNGIDNNTDFDISNDIYDGIDNEIENCIGKSCFSEFAEANKRMKSSGNYVSSKITVAFLTTAITTVFFKINDH